MSKDPAFLFYPNDYLGGTMGFSFEQHGAYLMLLIYQFNNGPFSEEKGKSIVGDDLFKSIAHKFDHVDGCICNARLMQEIEKRAQFSESRRENAQKRWKSSRKSMQVHSICNASAMHMGNENRNENEDGIDSSLKIKMPPTIESVREYCKERGNKVDPEKFFDFYQSKSWFVGKNKMKDWQAAVRNWERSNEQRNGDSDSKHNAAIQRGRAAGGAASKPGEYEEILLL